MTQAFCCWKVWNVFMLSPISVFTVWRCGCANGCKHACECIWANGRDLWYSCKIQPQESGCAYHTKLKNSINLLGAPAAHMSGWSSSFIPFSFIWLTTWDVDYNILIIWFLCRWNIAQRSKCLWSAQPCCQHIRIPKIPTDTLGQQSKNCFWENPNYLLKSFDISIGLHTATNGM